VGNRNLEVGIRGKYRLLCSKGVFGNLPESAEIGSHRNERGQPMTPTTGIRKYRSSTLLVFCIILVIVAATGTATAQISGSGSIQGAVTDPSGATVPQARVTAVNVATGVETGRQTTAAGLYVLSPLPAGEYNVRVAATGFQTSTEEHLVLEALQTVELNVQLKMGSASQQVTVEAAATALHTEDATLGGSMQNNIYEALPLAMGSGVPRDPTMFIGLIPGVTAVFSQASGPSYATFNGGQQENNGLYVEGLTQAVPDQQGDTRDVSLGISVEAVDQFQVETNGQKAMYQGQGIHNYVIKSGTNGYHGEAFELVRTTDFDARGFFAPVAPIDHQNEFGGNIGGPIRKDKLFFFGNYSGYYYKTATPPNYLSLPTTAERSGNFSALPVAIYDPTTEVCNGAVCSNQPFPGNIIPANRLSTVAESFQSYLTPPQTSGIQNNYLASLPKALHTNNTTEKVDWNQSEKLRLYAVFVRGKYATDYTGNLTNTGTALPLPYDSSSGVVIEVPTIAQIHATYVFTPTLLNQISVGLSRIWIPLLSNTKAGDYVEKAGLTGLPAGQAGSAFPQVSFSGPNAPTGWSTTGPFDEAENNYSFQDSLLWVRGRHSINIGFQLTRLEDNRVKLPIDGTDASFTFTNNETAGFSPTGTLLTTTGNAYASYMLGAVDSAAVAQNYVVSAGARYHQYGAYIQDDWTVSSRLTLNVGLRYDFFGPGFEVEDRMSFMNPNYPNPAAGGRLGALNFAGDGPYSCNCSIPTRAHYLNFEPRLGLAYKLDNKTVIRAGYILTTDPGTAGIGGNGAAAGSGLAGYNVTATFSEPATGQPAFYWDQGVPAFQKSPFIEPGYGAGYTTSSPTGAVSLPYVDPGLSGKPPYYMNWSIGLQREITPNMTVGAAYSASVGHFLRPIVAPAEWTNSMVPQDLVLGSLLSVQATPANIAAAQAIIPGIGLPFSNFQGTIAQMLKPFPQYSGITEFAGDNANSTFNSLQLVFNRRFSNGITFQTGYTLSKEIDDSNGSSTNLGAVGGDRDPWAGQLDKALGSIDRRHVFHGTVVYALPFGKGHRLAAGNAVARGIASGWQISGIVTFSSGAPIGITGTACNDPGITVGTCVPSYNPGFSGPVRINGDYGSGNALSPGAAAYYNVKAFMDPAAYTFGNLPRSAPFGLFAPHLIDEDVSLRREFAIHEHLKVAFTADVFNLTNAVCFAAPGTNIDSSSFGQVTTTNNLPRKLQLTGRITF
jgi:hypothetical protein